VRVSNHAGGGAGRSSRRARRADRTRIGRVAGLVRGSPFEGRVVVAAEESRELLLRERPLGPPSLGAVAEEAAVEGSDLPRTDERRRRGEGHEPVAQLGQANRAQVRRELRSVREERPGYLACEGPELLLGPEPLREDHVGAGLAARERASDGPLDPADRAAVDPSDDHEVLARGDRGSDLGHEHADIGAHLARELDRRAASPLELADGAHHHQRAAEPGAGVHEQRQACDPHDLPGGASELVERNEADVRHPHRGREGGPGHPEGPRAGLPREQSGEPAEDPWNDERLIAVEQRAEPPGRVLSGIRCEPGHARVLRQSMNQGIVTSTITNVTTTTSSARRFVACGSCCR